MRGPGLLASWNHVLWCVLVWSCPVLANGQNALSLQETGSIHIDSAVLQQEMRGLGGMDRYVLGIELLQQSATRIILADDTALAARELNVVRWPVLRGDSAPLVDATKAYWVRFPITPSSELKGVPLCLNVLVRAPVDLYMNGVEVLHAARRPLGRSGPLADRDADFHPMMVQITFACDGRTEVLAARVYGVVVDDPMRPPIQLALQSEQNRQAASHLAMHLSLCVGVNMILGFLAFITWWGNRRERSWLLLVLLTLLVAIRVLCDLGGSLGLAETSPWLSMTMLRALLPLFAGQLVLVVLVLREMRGDPIRPCLRRWIGPLLLLVAMALTIPLIGASLEKPWVRWPLTIIQLGIVIGIFTDVVRSAIRLLRQKGLEQWFAIGALTLTLVAFVAQVLSASGYTSFWVNVAVGYLLYLSMPVCVAIYMSLRAGRNNRLVARQRDELDLEVQERTAELRHEKERSDDLLRNILPGEVAEELKNTGAAQARHFDTVTILFSDFKGFTLASEKMSPQELVAELNTCFKAFDGIITARGIEKIKTIGDAYMCAGGLPDPATSAPVDVIHAASEMQAFMRQRRTEREVLGEPSFEMRVGIHTGPVVAGIVGVKKFQYDIWGDTVNTASRMESCGEVGQVNISEATYALVKDEPGLRFISRGKVEAKGKGGLEMYFVQETDQAIPVR
jgi:class 3 adenylate cyclase